MTYTFTDNFDRPNGPVGISPNGLAYTIVGGGTANIVSHQLVATPSGGNDFACVFDCADGSQDLSVAMMATPTARQLGFYLRYTDANNFVRVGYIPVSSGTTSVVLQVIVAGVAVVTHTFTGAPFWISGRILRVRASGNVYDVWVGTAHVGTYTDAGNHFLTVTTCGLYASFTAAATFDNFSVTTTATAIPPSTTFADTFNRANGPVGNSPNGTPYTGTGTWAISGGGTSPHVVSTPIATAQATLVFDAYDGDADVSALIKPGGFTAQTGVVLRWTDVNNWVALLFGGAIGSDVHLQLSVAGVVTTLTTYSVGSTPIEFSIRCVAVGNVYDSYVNGVHLGTYTDAGSHFLTVTKHGLMANNLTTSTHRNLLVVIPANALLGVIRPPFVPGGLFSNPAASPIVLTVCDRADPGMVLGTLDSAFSRTWQDQLNAAGSGEFEIPKDDPSTSLLGTDSIVRFDLYGAAAFAMLIENTDQDTIDPDEESAQTRKVTGRGTLAILEDAVVYPVGGPDLFPVQDTRTFDWTAPSSIYDDSGWPFADNVLSNSALTYPANWPAPFLSVPLWQFQAAPSSTPAGTCYFRSDFTAPADGNYLLAAVADDQATVYIDGQQVQQVSGSTSVNPVIVPLTAGNHTCAVQCDHLAINNAFGFLLAIYTASSTGALGTLLLGSTPAWKMIAYPLAGAPGMTPGMVVEILVAEAQARGVLAPLVLTFDDVLDSAGIPWPEKVQFSAKVGDDYLSTLIAMAATYVDVWIEPAAYNLWLWAAGGRGAASGVAYRASRTVTDGVCVAGNPTITSVAAAFDLNDVGRIVTGPGLPADAEIISIPTATTASLSAPALDTLTGQTWQIRGDLASLSHQEVL